MHDLDLVMWVQSIREGIKIFLVGKDVSVALVAHPTQEFLIILNEASH